MNVDEARKILGSKAAGLSDEAIQKDIDTARFFAEICFDYIKKHGIKSIKSHKQRLHNFSEV